MPSQIQNIQDEMRFQQNRYEDPNPTRWYLHNHRKDWIIAQLDRFVHPKTKVLEIGVGCGIFTRWLRQRGANVTATDVNDTFLSNVAHIDGVSTVCGDASEDLGFRDFDLLLCSEVIEHVEPANSQIFIQRMFDALRPGATAIVSTPQRYSSVEILARLFRFPAFLWLVRAIYGTVEELGHINLLTRQQFEQQITRAGFLIETEDLLGLYIPIIAEFGGKKGAMLQYKLGQKLKHIPIFKSLLWTQAYILKKPLT